MKSTMMIHGITTIPHPDFWKIAAHEGCTAIIGVDAHNNQYLGKPFLLQPCNRNTPEARYERLQTEYPFFNEK